MPIEGVTSFYFTQGVLGVTVVILGIVIALQDRRYRSDLKERDVIIAALQEKRVIDVTGQIREFLTTSQILLNQMKELLNLEVSNQKAIETIASILQRMKL